MNTLMSDRKFMPLSLQRVEQVMRAANIEPRTLTANPNFTFTATFDMLPTPLAEERVQRALPQVVLMPDEEAISLNKPNVGASLIGVVHFGFETLPRLND